MKGQITLLNIPFTISSMGEVLAEIEDIIGTGRQGRDRGSVTARYLSITNTESMHYALRSPDHFSYINNAALSLCDGVGIALAARLHRCRIPRLHGPDLMLACCSYGVSRNWRHYFYGGKEGVPERLAGNLSRRFPGLITAGTFSPPFRPLTPEEDQAVVDRINETAPDIVWVGLGLLKQERWIADHLQRIDASLMVGVGAAFDFYAGTIKRAPAPFRKLGLEWLYRLAFEPRMLVRNARSLLLVANIVKTALDGSHTESAR